MSKKRKQRQPRSCKDCHVKLPGRKEIELLGGPAWLAKSKYCLECSRRRGEAQRAKTGRKLLAGAVPNGTIERDGQTFTVITLPPKKPSR